LEEKGKKKENERRKKMSTRRNCELEQEKEEK
jgi:hypothetical protein